MFIAIVIFALPTMLNNYFIEKKTDTFLERVDNDFNDCVKAANENTKDLDWCKKIKRSSELAFNSAQRVSETNFDNFDITFFKMILFMLALITILLKRKVEFLENK
jgi:hypothetical protein